MTNAKKPLVLLIMDGWGYRPNMPDNAVTNANTPVLDQPRGPEFNLRMKPEEVQSVVEPAGFVLDKMVDVGPFHYAAIFYKITH